MSSSSLFTNLAIIPFNVGFETQPKDIMECTNKT